MKFERSELFYCYFEGLPEVNVFLAYERETVYRTRRNLEHNNVLQIHYGHFSYIIIRRILLKCFSIKTSKHTQ